MPTWLTVKNLVIATGLLIVWSQLLLWVVAGRTPSDALLAVGLGLLPVGAAGHVRTILSAPEAGSSSESSPPPSSPPPSPSSLPAEGTGE